MVFPSSFTSSFTSSFLTLFADRTADLMQLVVLSPRAGSFFGGENSECEASLQSLQSCLGLTLCGETQAEGTKKLLQGKEK